jgi:GNAT superfamily N-acetyltransferase
MNLRNLLTLTIQRLSFNLVAQRPGLVEELRKLTIEPFSGMNHELNWMLREAKEREIDCDIFLAYRSQSLVGWALLSKEDTDFVFANSYEPFRSENGWLFQVFIDPDHRRQGIASELLKRAQNLIGDGTLCICPWDEVSRGFYSSLNLSNARHL